MANYFTTLLIVWYALCAMPIALFVVSITIKMELNTPELKNILEYIALAVMLSVGLAGKFVYQSLLQTALKNSIAKEKMKGFLNAVLVYGALLESATMFAFVTYLLTKTVWVIGIGLAGICLMLLQTPTRQKCRQDLALTEDEMTNIEKLL